EVQGVLRPVRGEDADEGYARGAALRAKGREDRLPGKRQPRDEPLGRLLALGEVRRAEGLERGPDLRVRLRGRCGRRAVGHGGPRGDTPPPDERGQRAGREPPEDGPRSCEHEAIVQPPGTPGDDTPSGSGLIR